MSSTPTVRLDSVAYSHSIANETRRLVGGFHQVMHLGDFHCEVDQTKLVAMPVVDMTSVEEARLALEPYLRGWELRSELFENRPIKFKRAGHVVRDEVGGQVVGVEVTVEVEIASQATGVVTTRRLHLPEGPPLTITEEVRRVADRWRDVTTGKERLLVGAYWVLTELERYYWGRSEIGKRLAVSVKALNRLGETGKSERSREAAISGGDDLDSRIHAAAHTASCRSRSGVNHLPQITMANLPAIAR